MRAGGRADLHRSRPGRLRARRRAARGLSAIDRYVAIHAALAELERELNSGVDHPLMRELELPYPLSVGRIAAGDWSSTVPDRLEFEGRVGVPVGTEPRRARARSRRLVARRVPGGLDAGLAAALRAGRDAGDHPFAQLVIAAERGARRAAARDRRALRRRHAPVLRARHPVRDVRHAGARRAHAVDEYVEVSHLVALARTLVRLIVSF